jgi:hypothetical protein
MRTSVNACLLKLQAAHNSVEKCISELQAPSHVKKEERETKKAEHKQVCPLLKADKETPCGWLCGGQK